MTDEVRTLRDRLEAAQSELKRTKDELLTARAEIVTLQERVEYLEWSLNGGQSKDLVLQLAEARAEIDRLKQWIAAEPQQRPARRERVCLITVLGVMSDRGGPVGTQYVAFRVDAAGSARDIMRSFDVETARAAAEEAASELGVAVEDLT